MEITISDTQVTIIGDKILGYALNNLVNTLTVTTDKSSEWEYTLYVYMIKPKKYNTINLNRSIQNPDIVYVDLTYDMMPFEGRYDMQFVATKQSDGEVFRTEIFSVWIENSIDPSKEWTPVPSEFYQIENDINNMYLEVKEIYNDFSEGLTNISIIDGGNAELNFKQMQGGNFYG